MEVISKETPTKKYTKQVEYLKQKLANDEEYKQRFYDNKKQHLQDKLNDEDYKEKYKEYYKNYMKEYRAKQGDYYKNYMRNKRATLKALKTS